MEQNRKKVQCSLFLSIEDNNTLTEASKNVGLKKSEYLRIIIQGIGASKKDFIKDNLGYGFEIPNNVKYEILKNIAENLANVKDLKHKNNLRQKRIKKPGN
jgi:predicted DNA-binding protein